jgi:DNA-directed RNA polymerase specialized sigma24 family protein
MRDKPDRASGDSDLQELLNEYPSPSGPDSDLVRIECRREQFRRAARLIRPEFQPATWEAFWLTTVEGRSCEEVARELGKQIGSIYAARSRVMKRLQERVDEFEPVQKED